MRSLFSSGFSIENFGELKEKTERYVYERLKEQHEMAAASSENYNKFRSRITDLNQLPYYIVQSHKDKFVHSLNVAENCIKLCSYEKDVCIQTMELAGLLHDVSYFSRSYEEHGNNSAEMAAAFLAEESALSKGDIEKIKRIIARHYQKVRDASYYHSDDISLEEIILLEADFLDKVSIKSGLLCLIENGSKMSSIEKIIDKYQKKIIDMAEGVINQPVEKRVCHFTDSYLMLLNEQLEENRKIIEHLKKFQQEY